MQIYCFLECWFQPHCTSLQRLNKNYSFWLEKMKWKQSLYFNLRLLWLILLLSWYSRSVKDDFSPFVKATTCWHLWSFENFERRKRWNGGNGGNALVRQIEGSFFFTMDDAWLIFEWFPLNCFPPIRSSLLFNPSTLIALGILCGVKDNCCRLLDDILFDVGLIVDSSRYLVGAK